MHLDAFQQQINPLIFSKRRQALKRLEQIVRARLGINIAWPDLILNIKPEDMNQVVSEIQATSQV